MQMCIIYTDGSCIKNPGGPGGWAFIVHEPEFTWVVSGGNPSTTNNCMELRAAIEAIKFAVGEKHIIHTDSKWVMNCANGSWKRKAHLDMWAEFDKATTKKEIKWKWVKGHSGIPDNEIVDKLARIEAKLYNKK